MAISGTEEARSGREVRTTPSAAKLWRSRWLWLGLVIVLFCAPLFVGLDRTELENDEAIYSFAVKVMLETGDWLTPKSSPNEDDPFLEKPPLKFWIVAAPIRLGLLPDNEFGLRFWDVVFAGGAFLYVFSLGRTIGGRLCGLIAVLILFAHGPLLFEHGLRGNNMEASLVLAYCGGMYHFTKWRAEPRAGRRRLHLLAVALLFVLAFMTKFVAALFLPLVLAAAILPSRDARAMVRRDWRTIAALLSLIVVLVAPWFVYQYHRVGYELFRVMFGQHVFTRFTSYVDPGHVRPWYGYLEELFANLRREGALIVTAAGLLFVLVRTVRTRWRHGFLLLLWAALPLALMSCVSSKLYYYADPFLPPIALMAGYTAAWSLRVVWAALTRVWQREPPRRREVRFAFLRTLALAASLAAAGVAIATQLNGRVRLELADGLVLRNSSALRAWIVAAAALALAGRGAFTVVLIQARRLWPAAARTAVVAGVAALLLPLGGYRASLSALTIERHPVRDLRDCLLPLGPRSSGLDPRGRGVWAERAPTHVYCFYLRALGPFEGRNHPSDPTVFMHLYVPAKMRPVLLSSARYAEFTRLVNERDPVLVERAARKAGVDPAALAVSAEQTKIAVLNLPEAVLLLPGPYGACAAGEERGARR